MKQKWLVGETITTSKSSVSTIFESAWEPQPLPRTSSTGFSALRRVSDEEEREPLFPGGDGGGDALTLGVAGEKVRRAMTARSASVSLALSMATSSEGRAAGQREASRAKTSTTAGCCCCCCCCCCCRSSAGGDVEEEDFAGAAAGTETCSFWETTSLPPFFASARGGGKEEKRGEVEGRRRRRGEGRRSGDDADVDLVAKGKARRRSASAWLYLLGVAAPRRVLPPPAPCAREDTESMLARAPN